MFFILFWLLWGGNGLEVVVGEVGILVGRRFWGYGWGWLRDGGGWVDGRGCWRLVVGWKG